MTAGQKKAMDNIHNDELSGGSNKVYIDDRMGGNKNKGIQNKKAKYNHKNGNSSLGTNVFSKSEKHVSKIEAPSVAATSRGRLPRLTKLFCRG